ncbi:MAG: DUF1801 domain-containing protein [Rectinemataceae bacterium]
MPEHKPMLPEIETYFSSFPDEVRQRLHTIRNLAFELVPDATEAIKYRMPTIIWHGNFLHYAAYERHIGLYPLPGVLEALKDELKAYKTGKGSIQFPHDRPLPLELIRRIMLLRLEERKRGLQQ